MKDRSVDHYIGYHFRLAARVLLYAPSHKQDITYHGFCYTSRGAQSGTRNSPMGPPRANALTMDLHLAHYTTGVTKVCGMCYTVCEFVHIKDPLLLIGRSSQNKEITEAGFLSQLSGHLPHYPKPSKCVEWVVK